MTTKSKYTLLASISLLGIATLAFAADPAAASVGADAALAKLKEGNARFATHEVSKGKPTAAKRAETAQMQKPFAIVVGCADSRTLAATGEAADDGADGCAGPDLFSRIHATRTALTVVLRGLDVVELLPDLNAIKLQ